MDEKEIIRLLPWKRAVLEQIPAHFSELKQCCKESVHQCLSDAKNNDFKLFLQNVAVHLVFHRPCSPVKNVFFSTQLPLKKRKVPSFCKKVGFPTV